MSIPNLSAKVSSDNFDFTELEVKKQLLDKNYLRKYIPKSKPIIYLCLSNYL